jgi:hypothetical protein
MIAIRLFDIKPDEALEIVRELRSKGYKQAVDFDFAHFQGKISLEGQERRYTNFMFYNEKLATYFALRYK